MEPMKPGDRERDADTGIVHITLRLTPHNHVREYYCGKYSVLMRTEPARREAPTCVRCITAAGSPETVDQRTRRIHRGGR